MDRSADGFAPLNVSSRPAARRAVLLLLALLATLLMAWLLWNRASTRDGRPILRPDEFVSYEELSDFVGAPFGVGAALGSRYSYSLQTLRESSGYVLVETIFTDDELPTAAPRPSTPGSAGSMGIIVGHEHIAAHTGVERPPVFLSASDGCRRIVVSGTGFEPSTARIERLEELITARLADPDTVGYDFCQDG